MDRLQVLKAHTHRYQSQPSLQTNCSLPIIPYVRAFGNREAIVAAFPSRYANSGCSNHKQQKGYPAKENKRIDSKRTAKQCRHRENARTEEDGALRATSRFALLPENGQPNNSIQRDETGEQRTTSLRVSRQSAEKNGAKRIITQSGATQNACKAWSAAYLACGFSFLAGLGLASSAFFSTFLTAALTYLVVSAASFGAAPSATKKPEGNLFGRLQNCRMPSQLRGLRTQQPARYGGAPLQAPHRVNRGEKGLTFLTTPDSFFAGAFFFVTPVGPLPLTLSAAFFLVLGLVDFLRVVAGAVSTTGKTRGLEWPVWDRVPSRAIAAILGRDMLWWWYLCWLRCVRGPWSE